MLFRRDPKVPVTPSAQLAKLLYLRMHMLDIVFHGQLGWVVYADIAAETPKNAGNLEGEQF